jgi:hypothetical protein
MPVSFQIACLNSGSIRNSIALGACRAGALGVLDFEFVRDYDSIWRAIQLLNGAVRTPFGIKIDGDSPDCARIVARIVARVVEDVPDNLKTVILTSVRPSELQENVRLLQGKRITTLLEVTGIEQAQSGAAIGVDGLVAKGNEAGGRVADETTFVLLQRLQGKVGLPVWAHGGIGLHTVAACAAAGAAGVILDSQLALTRDYPLNDWIKSKIATMDGSETICLGESLDVSRLLQTGKPGSQGTAGDRDTSDKRRASATRSPSRLARGDSATRGVGVRAECSAAGTGHRFCGESGETLSYRGRYLAGHARSCRVSL